jgi:hypothetical protein
MSAGWYEALSSSISVIYDFGDSIARGAIYPKFSQNMHQRGTSWGTKELLH